MLNFSIIRIIATAEDGNAIVKQGQDEEKKEADADRGAAETVDGVWLAGGDNVAAVGGEELDCQEEEEGQEEKTKWSQ
ncbi:hypothetical protein GQ457_16G030890 [Hibiscus cannabinus]